MGAKKPLNGGLVSDKYVFILVFYRSVKSQN